MINGRTVGFFAGSALTAQPLPEICGALKAIGYDAVELIWPGWTAAPGRRS